MHGAVDQLKADYSAQHIVLVGYSGGGAIASLLAARRDDVSALITVAGNLDHQRWTTIKNISPLTGSLNPIDSVQAISAPQWHFYGRQDTIIPLPTLQGYQAKQPMNNRLIATDNGHHCCWAEQWPTLLQQLGTKKPAQSPWPVASH
jgi:pimeloyl-ACP methyl ester carboxylesterase